MSQNNEMTSFSESGLVKDGERRKPVVMDVSSDILCDGNVQMFITRLQHRCPPVVRTWQRPAPRGKRYQEDLWSWQVVQALQTYQADMLLLDFIDVPIHLLANIRCLALGLRHDPRYVLLQKASQKGDLLHRWSKSLRIGIGHISAMSQLMSLNPSLQMVPYHVSPEQLIPSLETGAYDGLVFPAELVARMSLPQGVQSAPIPLDDLLPLPGQGVLAVLVRQEDETMQSLLTPFSDTKVQMAVSAERAFVRELGGNSQWPITAYGAIEEGQLVLQGWIGSLNGEQTLHVQSSRSWTEVVDEQQAVALGCSLAQAALHEGALPILQQFPGYHKSYLY